MNVQPSRVDMVKAAAMLADGSTLHEIGQLFGVSRERIRQLAKKHGLSNGRPVRKLIRQAGMRAASNDLAIRRWGCSRAEYRALGRKVTDAFQSQRAHAAKRGIAWEFVNLWEWWCVWRDSGKWEQRGVGRDRYAMCRLGDCGPYAPWNVLIKTNRENSQECRARGRYGFVKGIDSVNRT